MVNILTPKWIYLMKPLWTFSVISYLIRDSDPPWINDDLKSKVKLKHKLYHRSLRHKRNNKHFAKLEHLRNETDNLIYKSKTEYYQNINRKLNDPLKSSETYWSIMKTFFNGKKVPIIPPLLFNVRLSLIFKKKQKLSVSSLQTIYITFK